MPLHTSTSTDTTPIDWWTSAVDWLRSFSETALTVAAIIVGAIIVWLIGRLIIRAIVKGITSGIDEAEDTAREVLRRTRLVTGEVSEAEMLKEKLEDGRRTTRANTIGVVLRAALNVMVLATTIVMVLSELGIPVTPMLASAGVIGVALGFGSQSLVKDLLAGLFMLIEDQYGVGDIVELGEASGVVEEFGLRTTRLRSLDGTVWYVPNGQISRVGNMTQLWSRALIEVRFDLDADVEAARQAMLDAVAAAEAADEDIAEAVIGEAEVPGVEQLDYNAVMLRLLVQVHPTTQWAVQRAVRKEMQRLFRERGIELAAPESSLIQSDRRRGRQP